MDDIELGVLIPIGQAQWGPGTDPRELPGFAVRAEELGYSSLWVNDSLLTPRIEALTMLAAVAPLTSRVTLGTAALLRGLSGAVRLPAARAQGAGREGEHGMRLPSMSSVIERRLLINYRVEPEVAAGLLPTPLRPQLVNGWAVAGICLIRLGQLRPSWVPGWAGMRTENAAHRVAVEWDGTGGRQSGVYIPWRDSDSVATVLAGGRLFPGEHHRALFDVRETARDLHVAFASTDGTAHASIDIRVAQRLQGSALFTGLGRHRASSGTARRDSPPPGTTAGSTVWNCAPAAGSLNRLRCTPRALASSAMYACSRQAARPSTALS